MARSVVVEHLVFFKHLIFIKRLINSPFLCNSVRKTLALTFVQSDVNSQPRLTKTYSIKVNLF
jgi:hypothetical protein